MASVFVNERLKNLGKDKKVKIEVITLVPSKWRFIDLETSQVWRWHEEKDNWVLAGKLKLPWKPQEKSLVTVGED